MELKLESLTLEYDGEGLYIKIPTYTEDAEGNAGFYTDNLEELNQIVTFLEDVERGWNK